MRLKALVFLLFGMNSIILSVLRLPKREISWEDSKAWKEYLSLYKAKPHQNIINEEDYCEKVRTYQKVHKIPKDRDGIPVSAHKVIYSDFQPNTYPKKVVKNYGNTVLEEHFTRLHPNMHPYEVLPPNISIYFMHEAFWHHYHKIGMHFLCEGQRYNHIPGSMHLSFKDETVFRFQQYGKVNPDFDPWKFMPYSLDLTFPEQCQEFFEKLKLDQFKDEVTWIIKKGRYSHNGEGITIIDPANAKRTLKQFAYGENCWEAAGYVAQKYVNNLFLINNKKFDFRVYMLIANMDPLILLYHNGFVRITLDDYDASSGDRSKHLTNLDVAQGFLSKFNTTEEDYQEALDNQGWSFERFEEYLLDNDVVEDGWVQDTLKNKFKETMYHVVKMNWDMLLPHPQVFESFGLDFIMDNDLNVWFIELNMTPCITEKNDHKRNLNKRFIESQIDLEYALMHGGDFDGILARSDFEWIYDGRSDKKYFN